MMQTSNTKDWSMRRFPWALLLVFVAIGSASAQDAPGDLRLTPANPRRGERVTVTYYAPASLKSQPRVVLRARERTIRHQISNTGQAVTRAVATLVRGGDGTFRGTYVLPDSVVYAALAVEDERGDFVDANNTAAWELLAHGADRKPEIDALDQRSNDLYVRNWEEAFATARRMIALNPHTPAAWMRLHAFDRLAFGDAKADSLMAFNRARVADLERHLDRGRASSRDIGTMAWYVWELGDSAAAAPWIARALREAPTTPSTLQLRGALTAQRFRSDLPRLLAELETLWMDAGDSVHPSTMGGTVLHTLAGNSQSIALRVGDSATIRRWSERYATVGRIPRRRQAERLASHPGLRPLGMSWLRDELRVLDELRPEHRFLDETVSEQRRRHEREKRPLLASLSRALIATGHAREGLDSLALVESAGWDVILFRTAALARLQASDTARALATYARVVADPRTAASFADSIAPLARRTIGDSAWSALIAFARSELPARVLARTVRRELRSPVTLVDTSGATHQLRALIDGRMALVVYWSRFCGGAVAELPVIDAIATRLAAQGVRIVSISAEPLSDDVRAFARNKRLTMPLYHDASNGVRRALGAYGVPKYWLLDARGNVRFTFDPADGERRLDDLVVLVEALQRESTQSMK